jgi:hypothetical protein
MLKFRFTKDSHILIDRLNKYVEEAAFCVYSARLDGDVNWISHFIFDSVERYELENDNFLHRFAELIADYRSYESSTIKALPFIIFDEQQLNERKWRVYRILNSLKKHENLNVRTFQGNWIDIPVTYYLDSVGGRTDTFWIGNRIGVDRLGNIIRRFPVDIIEGIFHVTRTGTHECSIESPVEWLRFIDSCYSLGCRNCGNEGWRAINRHKLPFREWMTSDDAMNDQNHFTFDETKFSDPVICTVFDTLKQKTLIVDGLHGPDPSQ